MVIAPKVTMTRPNTRRLFVSIDIINESIRFVCSGNKEYTVPSNNKNTATAIIKISILNQSREGL